MKAARSEKEGHRNSLPRRTAGKRPLGKPGIRWEDDIKMELKWDWEARIGFGSGQGPMVDACECGDEPSGSIKCGEFLIS